MSPIRVAVADDSSFIRRAVARLLDEEPDLELVGAAARGEELLANLELWSPDAIVLDLSLPGMSGLEVLDAIMQRRPTPVLILSTHSRRGAPLTLEALNRGAVDFIDKQEYSLLDFDRLRQALLTRLRGLQDGSWCPPSEPAVSSFFRGRGPVPAPAGSGLVAPEAIVFGASTGGPPAIERTLRGLGAGIDVPILVAQHMPPGFTGAFAERLDKALPLAVREAADGMSLEAGTVLLAPGGMHLRIVRDDRNDRRGGLRTRLSKEAGQASVNTLFHSAAECFGAACVAVVLTGMGNDGAEGMLQLARAGALTIAQDEATSIVFGMPRAAIELGAAREILPLPAIALRLREILNARHKPAEI